MLLKKREIVYHEKTVLRKPPLNLNMADRVLFEKEITSQLRASELFTYENVCVSPEGIVFKGLQLDEDLLIYPKQKKTYNWLYLLSSLIKRKKISLAKDETYLLIFDYWSNSIFHWMSDSLPRLNAVKQIAKNCVLLLPDNFEYPYIHDSLKAFEVKRILKIPVNAYVKCEKLICPQQITITGKFNPENIREVRQRILDFYLPKFENDYKPRNLYISRSKAKYRKVMNEDKVIEVLKNYDFTVIHYEDMTFKEQIELCYYAKNVISIHGANLTNVLFMKSGGNVMEFKKERDPDNHYFYAITDSVYCNYYYQECKSLDPAPGYNFWDLIVDLPLLKKNVELMMTNSL